MDTQVQARKASELLLWLAQGGAEAPEGPLHDEGWKHALPQGCELARMLPVGTGKRARRRTCGVKPRSGPNAFYG